MLEIAKSITTMDRNRSNQPSRVKKLSELTDLFHTKQKLQDFTRLLRHAIEMTSKRVFILKQSRKNIKEGVVRQAQAEELKKKKTELAIIVNIENNLRTKSLHLINLDELEPFNDDEETFNIYNIVKQLIDMNHKHIIQHTVPREHNNFTEIAEKSPKTKTQKILSMILTDQIKPKIFKEVRNMALEEFKLKSINRFKIKQSAPKEFKFQLNDRIERKKQQSCPFTVNNTE